MLKRPTIFMIIATAAILGIGIWLGLKQSGSSKSTTDGRRQIAARLRDFCNCYLIAESDAEVIKIDSMTGERQPYVKSDQAASLRGQWREYSPRGMRSAWVVGQQTTVFIVESTDGSLREIYRPPEGFAVLGLFWSGGQRFLAALVGPNPSEESLYAVDPTRIVRIDVEKGEVVQIIDVASDRVVRQLISRPVFITDSGERIAFAGQDRAGQFRRWLWIAGTKVLQTLPESVDFTIPYQTEAEGPWLATARANEQLFFGYRTSVSVVSLNDGSVKNAEIRAAGDAPYGRISPDRRSVLVTRPSAAGGNEIVLLDTESLQTTFVAEQFQSTWGLSDVVWNPEGSAFVVAEYGGPVRYHLGVVGSQSRLRLIEDPILPEDFSVRGAIPKQ